MKLTNVLGSCDASVGCSGCGWQERGVRFLFRNDDSTNCETDVRSTWCGYFNSVVCSFGDVCLETNQFLMDFVFKYECPGRVETELLWLYL